MYHDKRVRINRNITSPQVRLIDMHGTMLGIKPLIEAVNMARGANLDLVEISPQANPPVCKVMDFNKYLYEKEKQERDNRNAEREAQRDRQRAFVQSYLGASGEVPRDTPPPTKHEDGRFVIDGLLDGEYLFVGIFHSHIDAVRQVFDEATQVVTGFFTVEHQIGIHLAAIGDNPFAEVGIPVFLVGIDFRQ